MSGEAVVAKRYAKALFEIATEQGRVLEVEQELKAVVLAITSDVNVQRFITTPNISGSVKLDVLNKALEGKLSAPVINTIELLVERGRVEILSEMLNSYVNIAGKAMGLADAVVYTTYPLSDAEKQAVADQFKGIVNKTLRIENVVDKNLLGGMKVVIGDTLYDGSLTGKLARLEKSFNRRAL